MSKVIEFKDMNENGILDVDVPMRTVKAVWSKMGNVDLDNDIIVPEAYTKTLHESGPKGKNIVWSLVDHNASFKSALGKPTELYIEGDQLIAVTKIVDTQIGSDMIKFYNEGLINQHSIGYSTVKGDYNTETGIRTIKELKLYEGSAVLWGANPETPTLGLSKSMTKVNENLSLVQRLERLTKAWKNGTFTDDSFSLLELEIKQIQLKIDELTTQAAAKAAPEPEPNQSLIDAINYFKSKTI